MMRPMTRGSNKVTKTEKITNASELLEKYYSYKVGLVKYYTCNESNYV